MGMAEKTMSLPASGRFVTLPSDGMLAPEQAAYLGTGEEGGGGSGHPL